MKLLLQIVIIDFTYIYRALCDLVSCLVMVLRRCGCKLVLCAYLHSPQQGVYILPIF